MFRVFVTVIDTVTQTVRFTFLVTGYSGAFRKFTVSEGSDVLPLFQDGATDVFGK